MIKVSEYRIGNIVCWNPALTNPGNTLPVMHIEIASINADKIGYFAPGLEHRSEAFEDDILQTKTPYKNIEELEPVLLTSEIIRQAGFQNNKLSLPKLGSQSLFIFYDNTVHYQNPDGQRQSGLIKYLHQLQNLYFSLTGEELDITVN